jgi:hypothetical protein
MTRLGVTDTERASKQRGKRRSQNNSEKLQNPTKWSVRSMASAVSFSKVMIQRAWSDNGLKPHRIKTFKA